MFARVLKHIDCSRTLRPKFSVGYGLTLSIYGQGIRVPPSTPARSLNLPLICIYDIGLTNNIFTKKCLGTRLVKNKMNIVKRYLSCVFPLRGKTGTNKAT